MSVIAPSQITELVIAAGVKKAHLPTRATLILGFLAGAFISLGFLLAIHVSTMIPAQWASFGNLLGAAVFPIGLILVILAGGELLTGNMMSLPLAMFARRIGLGAVARNWLVCLAVWLSYASREMSGKILGIWFPIMAFVAIGFQHVVANMFLIPAAIFAGYLDWAQFGHNLLAVFLGNAVGGAIFVGLAYYVSYGASGQEQQALQ